MTLSCRLTRRTQSICNSQSYRGTPRQQVLAHRLPSCPSPNEQTETAVPAHSHHNSYTPSPHHPHKHLHSNKMVATQMFLGGAATLIASSTAFMAPMAVRSAAPASSSRLSMQSDGSMYAATLPGAPFSDGKVCAYLDGHISLAFFSFRATFGFRGRPVPRTQPCRYSLPGTAVLIVLIVMDTTAGRWKRSNARVMEFGKSSCYSVRGLFHGSRPSYSITRYLVPFKPSTRDLDLW